MTSNPAVGSEHDLFIQQITLENALREWMGADPVTHSTVAGQS